MQPGQVWKEDQRCKMGGTWKDLIRYHRNSIFQIITPKCLDGSRAWRSLFANEGFGQSLDHWMPNVRASSAFLARLTAAHAASCSVSLISTHSSCILRSTSPQEVTFVTFTQNTTVSSTSLSSTGAQPSFVTSHHHWLWILMQWRRMLLHALMMFLCSRSNGKISSLPW